MRGRVSVYVYLGVRARVCVVVVGKTLGQETGATPCDMDFPVTPLLPRFT